MINRLLSIITSKILLNYQSTKKSVENQNMVNINIIQRKLPSAKSKSKSKSMINSKTKSIFFKHHEYQ